MHTAEVDARWWLKIDYWRLGKIVIIFYCMLYYEQRNSKYSLSIYSYRFNLFYGYRDEDVHACKGMGEEEEFSSGRIDIPWLLLWILDGICAGWNLPTKTLWALVAVGLLFYCISHCLAFCISMVIVVLANGKNR